MAVSMLHAPSRASTSSSSSFIPVSRQNTMSSHDGSRSVRQSKRYSVTALYLSMSAKDKELEIEDDLARGTILSLAVPSVHAPLTFAQPRRSYGS
jgi:Ras GTPase-activating-like protein IQGAP2/3